MNLSFDEIIAKRRSVRNYNNTPVTGEELLEIVKAGTLAPSVMDKFTWTFLGLTKETSKEYFSIARKALGKDLYFNAPNVILVLISASKIKEEFVDLDVGPAMENMFLKATSLGLETCWIHSARYISGNWMVKNFLKRFGYGDAYLLVESLIVGHGEKMEEKKADLNRAKVI